MKIAVTALGPQMSDEVSSRFGRAPYFLVVDSEDTTLIKSIENPNVTAGGGAGVQSAQTLADENVAAVLTGNCGPKAFQVFGAAGIDIHTAHPVRCRTPSRNTRTGNCSKQAAPMSVAISVFDSINGFHLLQCPHLQRTGRHG